MLYKWRHWLTWRQGPQPPRARARTRARTPTHRVCRRKCGTCVALPKVQRGVQTWRPLPTWRQGARWRGWTWRQNVASLAHVASGSQVSVTSKCGVTCPRGVREPGGVAGRGVKMWRHLPTWRQGARWRGRWRHWPTLLVLSGILEIVCLFLMLLQVILRNYSILLLAREKKISSSMC